MATVAELRTALDAYGVVTTTRMKKAELEAMLTERVERDRAALATSLRTAPEPLTYLQRQQNYQRQNGTWKVTTRQARSLYKNLKRAAKRQQDEVMMT